MTGHVAVIDQGSTSTKGAVFSLSGERVDLVSVPVERHHDGPRVTHDPATLADGVVSLVHRLARERSIAAIGLACQRSTCLIWDRASGRPLSEALSWQDRSQSERVARLAPHAAMISARTGLRLSPYYAAPKLAALLERLPNGYERAVSGEIVGGTLDAFLVHRLTGEPATEPGTAGRTLLYNLDDDAWDEELCDLFALPPAMLPRLRPSADDWGEVGAIPLLAVAGDQQASLLGHGGWRLGTVAAHFGTGAFVLASTGTEVVRHEGLLSAVLASTPETRRFQIEGSVNSAGSAVDWARSFAGIRLEDWSSRPLSRERPWVLPAFSGLGAPLWRSETRAVIAGLDISTPPEALFSGVVAGVGHRILDCLEAIREAGVRTDRLSVSGKLTRLGGLVRLLADAGRIPVEVAAEEETGALGMARLVTSRLDLGRPEGGGGPLDRPATIALRVEPEWTADRAERERSAWRDFLRGAVELSPPSHDRPDD